MTGLNFSCSSSHFFFFCSSSTLGCDTEAPLKLCASRRPPVLMPVLPCIKVVRQTDNSVTSSSSSELVDTGNATACCLLHNSYGSPEGTHVLQGAGKEKRNLHSNLFIFLIPHPQNLLDGRQWCDSQIAPSSSSTAGGVHCTAAAQSPSRTHPHPLCDFRRSRSKVSGSYSPPHAETDCPRFPPRGKSAATNTTPARKQIGCLMTAVIFETLSLKSASNHRLNLYGHQAAPRRAGRAILVVRLGNGLRAGWDCLIASKGKIWAGV